MEAPRAEPPCCRDGLRVDAVQVPVVALHGRLSVGVRIENAGVAPFYYDWPVQIAAVDWYGPRHRFVPVGALAKRSISGTSGVTASGTHCRAYGSLTRNEKEGSASGTLTLSGRRDLNPRPLDAMKGRGLRSS